MSRIEAGVAGCDIGIACARVENLVLVIETGCGDATCDAMAFDPRGDISSLPSIAEPGRPAVPGVRSYRRFGMTVGVGSGPTGSPLARFSSASLAMSSHSLFPESTWRW